MGNRLVDIVVGLIGLAAGLPSAWRWLTTTEDGQRAGTALMALWLAAIGAWAGWQARGMGGTDVVRAAELDQAATIAELRGRLLAAEATAAVAIGGAMPRPQLGSGGPGEAPEPPSQPALPSPLGGAPVPMVVPTPPAWMPWTVTRWYDGVILPAAQLHGVDPVLAAIIVTVESGGDPTAGSGAGAMGLYQVVPRYHPRLLEGDPHDPDHNADVGTAYLAECLRRYGVREDPDWQRSVERAAACYNGGGGGVTNPAAETRSYIRWVGGMWAERHDATSPTFDAWMQAGGSRLVRAAQSH